MNVLIACEYSGVARDAFTRMGHNAWSCDLLPTESEGQHYIGNILDALDYGTGGYFEGIKWDLLIAHPPCTFLCSSGLHWNKKDPSRELKTQQALDFVKTLWDLPIPKKCIENPVGCINTRLPEMPKPQYIQPYEFGHDASKKTGLWLSNLPELKPTKYLPGRIVTYKNKQYERWDNQTDSGQNKLGPSEHRGKDRSRTYEGIAQAMAEQWGGFP